MSRWIDVLALSFAGWLVASVAFGWTNPSSMPSGGAGYIIVDASGNVGIGATPAQKLHVNGSVRATQLCIASDCRSAWPADANGDISGVTASTGLTGGGTTGSVTLSADTTYLQRRIASCPVGSGRYLRVINADGTVTCNY